MVKKQRKKLLIEKRQSRGTAREGHIGARSKREVVPYAMARRSNAKDWAKVAGRPWSVTESLGASERRALRARRCSQERRRCAPGSGQAKLRSRSREPCARKRASTGSERGGWKQAP